MYVKVCGITHLDDALAAIAAGVDVLGFNFVPASKRYIEREAASRIVERVRGEVICVAVVANLTTVECRRLCAELGIERVQLHGDETPDQVRALAPGAYKALRIATGDDVAGALAFAGDRLLVDAKVEGQLGGTGRCIDWPLVAPLARARPLILAGGLTPQNVEDAVRVVQPWAVDTAGGVESDGDVRRKDARKMLEFTRAARRAAESRHPLVF